MKTDDILVRVDLPRMLGPRYRLEALLGKGGMGEVYAAKQLGLGREVAIKLLVAGAHAPEELLTRLRREAQLAAGLSHPGIVRVLDQGQDGPLHFVVMELVRGKTLAETLAARGGRLPPGEALEVARQVARALEAAHERGVIHRDVKPGNVMLDARGKVRVTDFGLAKAFSGAGSTALTATGSIVGTPAYMAPEQAFGAADAVGPAADVYALAATLFEMLTGRPPHVGATTLALLRKLESEEPPPASSLAEGIPPALDALVRRGLAKDPARRPAGAAAFADELEAALGSLAPASGEPDEPRNRTALLGALLGAAALLPVGLAVALLGRGAPREPEPAPTVAPPPTSGPAPRPTPPPPQPVAPAPASGEALSRALARPAGRARREALRALAATLPEAGPERAALERALGRFGRAAAATRELRLTPAARVRRALDLLAARPVEVAVFGARRESTEEALAREARELGGAPEGTLLLALLAAFRLDLESAQAGLAGDGALPPCERGLLRAHLDVERGWTVEGGFASARLALDGALAAGAGAEARALEVLLAARQGDDGRTTQALERLEAEAPSTESAETALVRAAAHVAFGRADAARAALEVARDLGGDDASVREDAALLEVLAGAREAIQSWTATGKPRAPTAEERMRWTVLLAKDPRPLAELLRAWLALFSGELDVAAAALARGQTRPAWPWLQGDAPELAALLGAFDRPRLLSAARDILATHGRLDEARAFGEQATAAAAKAGDPELHGFALLGQSRVAALRGETEPAVTHFRAALAAELPSETLAGLAEDPILGKLATHPSMAPAVAAALQRARARESAGQ